MTMKLEDLKFGELNNIKRNNLNASGDRRRTTTSTAIRLATEKAFEVNTLVDVTSFTGFVVGARPIDRPISEYKGTIVTYQSATPTEGDKTQIMNFLYKVYIPELEPLPAPESYQDPVIGLYADVSIAKGLLMSAGDEAPPAYLQPGALVEVTYEDVENLSGPKIVRIISAQAAGGLDMGAQTSLRGDFTASIPIGSGANQGSFVTSKRKIKTLTWAERVTLYNALKPLFEYISGGEGGINSINRGIAGDTKNSTYSSVFTDGKSVDKRAIGDVQKLYKGRALSAKVSLYKKENTTASVWRKYKAGDYTEKVMKSVDNPGILAAGKFQWVRGTFDSTIKACGLTKDQLGTLIFNRKNQEIMATYLILDKSGRSRLGGYLLGLHDNVSDAGQELAMEFASVPNQFNAKNGLSKKNWICPRGYNHYCSDPTPGAEEGANASYRPTRKKPDSVAQKLREARDAMAKNPEAVAIARRQDASAFA